MMRLMQVQRRRATELAHQYLGNGARVFLYGSRLDDAWRGGDVDQAALKLALEKELALPVDLLFLQAEGPRSSFQLLAMSQAQAYE